MKLWRVPALALVMSCTAFSTPGQMALATVPVGANATAISFNAVTNPLTNEICSANVIGQNATIFAGPPASLPVLLLESVQPKLN